MGYWGQCTEDVVENAWSINNGDFGKMSMRGTRSKLSNHKENGNGRMFLKLPAAHVVLRE